MVMDCFNLRQLSTFLKDPRQFGWKKIPAVSKVHTIIKLFVVAVTICYRKNAIKIIGLCKSNTRDSREQNYLAHHLCLKTV